MPEIVFDGQTGLLYTPGDVAELVQKITALCESPSLCKELGAAGRAKALRQYSPHAVYAQLSALYAQAKDLV